MMIKKKKKKSRIFERSRISTFRKESKTRKREIQNAIFAKPYMQRKARDSFSLFLTFLPLADPSS